MSDAGTGSAHSQSDDDQTVPPAYATRVLLALIWLLFAGEVLVPAGAWHGLSEPSISTLVAWGGMSGTMVLERGESFRVFTAALLHGGYVHLLFNSYALYSAGRMLEPLVGWPWFVALYVLGALGGGLASVAFNAPNIVGIGASGAIMGLFGFILTIALRFPSEIRRLFVINGLSVLIPSTLPVLLPALTGGEGMTIDYAAHIGGGLTGAVLGLGMAWIWRRTPYPPGRALALAIAAAGAGMVIYGASILQGGFAEQRFAGSLIPEAELARLDLTKRTVIDDLIARHPEDPRAYLGKAQILMRLGNTQEAEKQAGHALERVERFPGVFTQAYRVSLRAFRAGLQMDLGRREAARATAAPICSAREPVQAIAALKTAGLCP